MRGCDEAAVIEDRTMEENIYRSQIEVNGRFISSYMDRRLIRPTLSFNGKVEVAMRKLLTDAVAIPRVILGTLNGFNETVTFQATYKNLLEYETKLAKCAGIGFRFRPDFNNKRIIFETFKGTDRSTSQSRNNRVIFSEAYANLNDMTFRENNQLLKNVVFIGGSGTGNERIYVSYGDATGLDRRELYVDARDIMQTEDMTDAEYRNKLLQRGHERQTSYQLVSSIGCDTDALANFVYKENYDLGDIVSIKKAGWNISVDMRITEIQEIYERGTLKVSPTFGNPLPDTIDWSDE